MVYKVSTTTHHILSASTVSRALDLDGLPNYYLGAEFLKNPTWQGFMNMWGIVDLLLLKLLLYNACTIWSNSVNIEFPVRFGISYGESFGKDLIQQLFNNCQIQELPTRARDEKSWERGGVWHNHTLQIFTHASQVT